MDAYFDNRIVTARKHYECEFGACEQVIKKGDECLIHRMAKRMTRRICMGCALSRNNDRPNQYGLVFDCEAVRRRLDLPQSATAGQ